MDPIDQDQIELKQETIHEDHNTTGMKEEPNQDPEYGSNEASGSSDQQIQSGELMDPIDQDQIELKQETIHEDHNTTGMKEEPNQDPEYGSNEASGSSDQQVSVDELPGKNGFRTGLKRLWTNVWRVSEKFLRGSEEKKEKMADDGPWMKWTVFVRCV
ncbi:hypothetical protein Q5P01_002981 [Channa striata]|uniref:Uncharacterized protein n=1 Tax=Channa striata TaxID=64152 RepID=A0AA88T6R0_CHASR|nr:hypothetical protein Q5P01_002981 [Channa striata]